MSVSNKKISIGTHSLGYNEVRFFAGLPYKNYEVKKVKDFIRIPAHLYWRLKNTPHPFLSNLFFDAGLNGIPLFHFFNAVNCGNTPWITTFERYLPRGVHRPHEFANEKKYIDFALKRVAHPSCKKLIAISNYAYRSQVRFLKEYGKYEGEILPKIEVIQPAQQVVISSYDEKETEQGVLTFTFAGADFFRKGGKEILAVFEQLLSEKLLVKLNIISTLDYGDYASKATLEDKNKAQAIISKYSQMNHQSRISHAALWELLRKSDVALLPSYDETYGLFTLDSQALGCPVITTNGGAMPESNNTQIGWMIDVPLFEDGRSFPRSESDKKMFSELVETKLYAYILEMLKQPNIIRVKGERALQHIRQNHNVENTVERLEKIYKTALS